MPHTQIMTFFILWCCVMLTRKGAVAPHTKQQRLSKLQEAEEPFSLKNEHWWPHQGTPVMSTIECNKRHGTAYTQQLKCNIKRVNIRVILPIQNITIWSHTKLNTTKLYEASYATEHAYTYYLCGPPCDAYLKPLDTNVRISTIEINNGYVTHSYGLDLMLRRRILQALGS